MVEYTVHLDSVFYSLSDPTRRDILTRLRQADFSVGELVYHYDMSFAAVSKHIKILETAQLICKRKEGRKHIVSITPNTLETADHYLQQYRDMWQSRYNKLDTLIQGE